MQIFLILILHLFLLYPILAQQGEPTSIHHYEAEKYRKLGDRPVSFYDSLNAFRWMSSTMMKSGSLTKRVFGYHPYWGGSNYLNYRWDLISDLCYFSYEVDPETGYAATIHDWIDTPAIDSALSNGVRVHLCVTLFSGHALFFTNPVSWQNLANEVIDLIGSRGADGVNLDIEALPSLYKEEMNAFIVYFANEVKAALPEAEVSIAVPAVNWNNKFDLPTLTQYLDFFMVMAYDYYWSGSATAGPVSPLYSMTSNYNYSFCRTVSYYQSQGIAAGKIVLGVPYYAYQWRTDGPTTPSPALTTGVAYTYRYVRDNNTGSYTPENLKMESNSFAPYYAFQQSDNWHQCFLDNPYSLSKKYDEVLHRDLGGIGIWALGYDNGYSEFWDLIQTRFTGLFTANSADTIYDSGGPSWDYYDEEGYAFYLRTPSGTNLYLSFSYLDTEAGYDTLWIYDGPDVSSSLIGFFSGQTVPSLIKASSNSMTLKFKSDAFTVDAGWRAVYDTLPVSGSNNKSVLPLVIYPNPSREKCRIILPKLLNKKDSRLIVYDLKGRVCFKRIIEMEQSMVLLSVEGWDSGVYQAAVENGSCIVGLGKIIVLPR